MNSFGWLVLIVALFILAFLAYLLAGILTDRHETAAANAAYRGLEPRTIALPVLERTVPRHAATGRPPWPVLRPGAVRSGPLTPDLPALGSEAAAGPTSRVIRRQIGADGGEPAVPVPPAPTAVQTGTPRPGEQLPNAAATASATPPATYPEWVAALLDGDLTTAVAADLEHCQRMGWAA